MGVAGPRAQDSNAEGAGATHPLSASRGSRRLIAALPEHLAAMAAFSLATGLRAANVTGLQWSQSIWYARWRGFIRIKRKDGGRYRFRSIRKRCYWYVNGWEARDARVQLSGKPISRSARRLGMRARAVPASKIFAGMTCGTPGRAGMCSPALRCSRCRRWVAGQSAEMVRRYAHLAADHLAPFAEKLCKPLTVVPQSYGTNSSQPGN